MNLLFLLIASVAGLCAGYILHLLISKNKTVPRENFESQSRDLIKAQADLQHNNNELHKLTQQIVSLQSTLQSSDTELTATKITASNNVILLQNLQQKINELNISLLDETNQNELLSKELEQKNQAIAITAIQLNNALQAQEAQKESLEVKEGIITTSLSRITELSNEVNKLSVHNNAFAEKLATQKQEVIQLQENAQLQFEKIARLIFEEKTARFTETNKQNMESLLAPLKADINNFKIKVEETYDKESKQRFSLEEKVKDLIEQTNKVSNEANNLASALKGQNKTQGNWGEMILERILETSGLTKDREYFTQQTIKTEDGKNLRPDVFVHLPDNRVIIIDSKVSLNAYERYYSATESAEQKNHLASHMNSIYSHINELSNKKYDDLENALDFTMMFIPIEPAYVVSIQADQELWNYAYAKRILLVSPTNLIACLKIISDVWKREKQSRNAREIVKRGELLYEKVVAFISSMEDLGKHLNKTQNVYQTAIDQLKNSRGNLVYQAVQLQSLGLKSNKTIPDSMLTGDFSGDEATND